MTRRILIASALATLIAVSAAVAGLASTVAPKLTGTVAFDRTVTCDPGTFTPPAVSLSYAWTANRGPIANQTTNTLTINAPYLMGGYDIGCTVTATDASGSTTSVSSPAVRPALGATTLKITSIKTRKKGVFVVKGQIGPAHLVANDLKGSEVVLDRKVPGQAKAVYQLGDLTAVDRHGRFTVTGHDKAGRRKVMVNFFPGHDGSGLWAPVTVTRAIKVSAGHSSPPPPTVGIQ